MSFQRMASTVLLTCAAICGAALNQPERTMLGFDGGGSTPIRFQHGYFVTFSQAASTISIIDRQGHRIPDVVLRDIPGVSGITIRAVAISPEGLIAASAACYSAESQAVSVLILADRSGKVLRVVRTSPYSAMTLGFATDGTLWTTGRESGGGKSSVPGHHIVRQFDNTGKLLRSLLAVETFSTPQLGFHPGDLVEMAAQTGGGMSLFIPAGSEWVEISKAGEASRTRLPVATDGSELVTGIALADNGDPLLSVQPLSGEGMARLMRYRRAEGKAEIVQRCELKDCEWSRIVGADGEQLVLEGRGGSVGWFLVH